MPVQKELTGKVALVTGGSKGIGRAIALALAQAGAAVALVARHPEALQETARSIEQHGGHALPLVCDVTAAAQVQQLPAKVEARFGPIAILVNMPGPLEATSSWIIPTTSGLGCWRST